MFANLPTRLNSINGKRPGTNFGDDIKITKKVPFVSAKWAEGLPLYSINSYFQTTGYWEIPEIEGELNGVCEFGSGSDPNGHVFITSKALNRYQAGQKGYNIYTGAFGGVDQANGDFELLVGPMLPGLAEDGEENVIVNGIVWGYIWDSENSKATLVYRVYKNKTITHEVFPDQWKGQVDFRNYVKENLHIFYSEFGYLGIDPSPLEIYDQKTGTTLKLHEQEFDQNVTNVSNPNMTLGVWVKNKGNTNPIWFRNGSFQFGNFSERITPDPSSRSLIDQSYKASVASGTQVPVVAYTIPTKASMISRVDGDGITTSIFRNTISNKLLSSEVFASLANQAKPARINLYFTPIDNITGASFVPIRPNRNVLEKSDNFTITDRGKLEYVASLSIENEKFVPKDFSKKDTQLLPGIVAVLEYSSSSAADDLTIVVDTEDLF